MREPERIDTEVVHTDIGTNCFYCGKRVFERIEYYGKHGREENYYRACDCERAALESRITNLETGIKGG